MSSQYGELRPTSGWDLLASLGHPCKFQRVSRLGSVTVRHSSSERQPNFATLNRGRHLYLSGRPSRWALAHISSYVFNTVVEFSDVNVLKRLLDHVELCACITSRPIFMAALCSSPSLAFSYIGSITARHSTNGRQPNFAAWYKEWNTELSQTPPPIFGWAAITLGIGPHSSCVSLCWK